MAQFRDLHEFVSLLEARGKLHRFTRPINKDTELYPVFRVQQRGLSDAERKVLLFENVVGAKGNRYQMPVLAGVYGASEEIVGLGLGFSDPVEGLEKWHEALAHPLEPVLVDSGSVQEEVMVGEEVKRLGLDILPVPVEEPGFSGVLRTGLPMITRDPESGVRNVGTYNGFLRARDRLQAAIGPIHDAMAYHWQTARRRGEPLPLAIVIGCNPEIMAFSSAELPYGFDELGAAGGLAGTPVELVRCKTIPLEVPAHAEAVIEGYMSTDTVEPRLPFGEYPGYIHVDLNVRPVFHVTAITHRRDAMFTAVLVGFPPSDTSVMWGFVHAGMMYHHLKYEQGLPIEEVYFPDLGGGSAFAIVRISDGLSQEQVQTVVDTCARYRMAKWMVVVDYDVNVRDPELLIWALSFRTAAREDFTFVPARFGGLDPSSAPTGSGRGKMGSGGDREQVRVVINATRKWPYPPVALPKRPYMERALEIWREERGLPQPHMRVPWYGYTLGYWTDELQRYADLIVQGEYLKIGDEMLELQEPVREEMITTYGRRGE